MTNETTTTPEPGTLTYRELAPIWAAVFHQLGSYADRLGPKVLEAKVKASKRALEKLLLGTWFVLSWDRRGQLVVHFESESEPGRRHATTARGCRCKAGRRARAARKQDLVCWHVAARTLVWRLMIERAVPTPVSCLHSGGIPGYVCRSCRAEPAPLADAYQCPSCEHAMVWAKTPGGEACVECSNPRCQKTYMDGFEFLVPLAPDEAAGVARVLGRAA